jgi:hypothetical protein
VCARACAGVCARDERVRLRVCVHLDACALGACMRAHVSACVCGCVFPSGCVFARRCVASVCACASRLHAPCHRTAATCGINSSARAARRRPRAGGCVRCHRPGSRASAAGFSWTSRTAKAEWAGRSEHTSVVDAAGAIYVIGGGSGTVFPDVWASADGGAQAGLARGWGDGRCGVLEAY